MDRPWTSAAAAGGLFALVAAAAFAAAEIAPGATVEIAPSLPTSVSTPPLSVTTAPIPSTPAVTAPVTIAAPVTSVATVATTVGEPAHGSASTPSTAPGVPGPPRLSPLERDVVAGINSLRGDRGLRPLTVSAALTQAARAHAISMARGGYFGHDSADGTPFWKRIGRYYPLAGHARLVVGENLYWSTLAATSFAINHAWVTSPEHRRILFANWTQLGIAILHRDDAPGFFGHHSVLIAVADFGRRS
jgi:uncharacterized protein YkwD